MTPKVTLALEHPQLDRPQSGVCTLCPHSIGQNLVTGPHLNAKGWDIQFLTGLQFSHDGSAPTKGSVIFARPRTQCFPGTEVGDTGSEFDEGWSLRGQQVPNVS